MNLFEVGVNKTKKTFLKISRSYLNICTPKLKMISMKKLWHKCMQRIYVIDLAELFLPFICNFELRWPIGSVGVMRGTAVKGVF